MFTVNTTTFMPGKQTLLFLITMSAISAKAQQQGVSAHQHAKEPIIKTTMLQISDTAQPVAQLPDEKNFSNIVTIKKSTLQQLKIEIDNEKKKIAGSIYNSVANNITGNRLLQSTVTSYKQLAVNTFSEIKQRLQHPWRLNNFSFIAEGSANNYENDSFLTQNYNVARLSAGASMLGVPFGLEYMHNYYPFYAQQNLSRFSYSFQRDDYLQSLQNQLKGKFNPSDFMKQATTELEAMKNNALSSLQNELHSIGAQYKGLLDNSIRKLGNLQDVMSMSPNTLRQLLTSSEWLQDLQAKTTSLQQLQEKINSGQQVDMQSVEALKNALKEYEGVQAVISRIEEHKSRWEQNGLMKLVRESGLLNKQQLVNVIKDPSVITSMAKAKLNLNGFQRLFLKISGLNLGQDATNMGSLTSGNFLMNGLNGSLFNNNRYLGFLGGVQRSFNSLNDLPFASNLMNTDNRLMGLSIGSGAAAGNSNRLSLMHLRSLQNGNNPFSIDQLLPRSALVATFNKRIEFDKMNNVEVEFSKSANQYRNQVNADSNAVNKLLNNFLGNGNFLDNAAIGVQYHGYYKRIQLQQDISVRFAGDNYQNLAGGLMPAGTKEVMANLKKYFLKNKLQFTLRGQLRQYDFNSASGNQWRNTSYMADVKWKMKKSQYVSLRWQPVQSMRVGGEQGKLLMARTNRVAASASLAKRIRGMQYRNAVTLAYQDNKLHTGSGQYSVNQSLQFTSLQSFTVGKQLIYANLAYNHVNNPSDFIFYNTSFNADAGLSYQLGEHLNASSALSYQSVQQWYRQVSLKQTLTGQLGKSINLNLYIDAGKALKQFQPLPMSLIRGEWSIQYLFNR
jgi:hypothetical protein